jgi:hypothetical protein
VKVSTGRLEGTEGDELSRAGSRSTGADWRGDGRLTTLDVHVSMGPGHSLGHRSLTGAPATNLARVACLSHSMF